MKELKEMMVAEQQFVQEALEKTIQTLPTSVQEIARYALLSGGKRLRPLLTLICSRLFSYSNKDIYDISIVLEMFHVASLLHDDVLDDAKTRRGKTSPHLIYGIKPCLLAGDALLAAGNYKMAQYSDERLMTSISEALLKTSSGEIAEIELLGKVAPVEEYLHVIEGKTAWILRSACEVGAIRAGASAEDIAKLACFGLNLGMAFQMVDDALDFAPEEWTGKPQGGDLREKKCTPPISMYIDSLNGKQKEDFIAKFSFIADQDFSLGKEQNSSLENFTEEEFKHITQEIIEEKFPEKTREIAQVYLDKAREAIADFSGIYKDILVQTLDYVQSRNK